MWVKSFTCLVICVFSVQAALAQQAVLGLQKAIGGTGSDNPTRMLKLPDGGFMLLSITNSSSSADKASPSYGSFDYWLLKLSPTFEVQWEKTWGGTGDDSPVSLISLSDGNFLLSGSSSSPASGNKTAPLLGVSDFWVIKVNAQGNELWQKTFGGTDGDRLGATAELSDGSLLFGGGSYSDTSSQYINDVSNGGSDFWLLKTDAAGNYIWDAMAGGADNEEINDLVLDSAGNILLAGYSSSGQTGDKTEPLIGNWDIWAVKMDAQGNILWDRTLGGAGYEMDTKILARGSDCYVACASATSSTAGGNKTEAGYGDDDVWMVKLDQNGDIVWNKVYGGDGAENVRTLYTDGMENIVMSAASKSDITGIKTESGRGGYDCWLVAIDANGGITWQKTLGGTANDAAQNVVEISAGHYAVYGFSLSGISGDKTVSPKGGGDLWLVELYSTLSVNENEPDGFELYPNPTAQQIHINLQKQNGYLPENATLQVADVAGRIVLRQGFRENLTTLDLSALPNGAYTITLLCGSQTYQKKVLKLD